MEIWINKLGQFGLVGAFVYYKNENLSHVTFNIKAVSEEVNLVKEIKMLSDLYPNVVVNIFFIK